MGMKNTLGMLAMMAAFSDLGTERSYREFTDKEEKEKRERQRQLALETKRKKQGIKEFNYGENKIFARNQKNADRKARNLGYI